MSGFDKGSPPRCRVCNKELTLLDGDEQRWYCPDDDELFLGKEQRWVEKVPSSKLVSQPPATFCWNCGAQVAVGTRFCQNCGAATEAPSPPKSEKTDISVEEVLASSLNIIRRKPMILLPQVIVTTTFTVAFTVIFMLFAIRLLSLLSSFVSSSFVSPSALLESLVLFLELITGIFIVAIVLGPIIQGMYPLMVKNVTEGKEVDVFAAFRKAVRRFPSLIGSAILAFLIVAIGLLFLIVPGIIFLTWYYYTVPAIMLEKRGALDGMSASKRFGRTQKSKTLLIVLVLSVIGGIAGTFAGSITGIGGSFFMPSVAGLVISTLISTVVQSFVAAWGSVIRAYVYIKYAMPAQNP